MDIGTIVKAYVDFFNWETRMNGKLTVDDKPLEMHPLKAIGEAPNAGQLAVEASSMGTFELSQKSERLFKAGFISMSFFYFFVSEMKSGRNIDSIKEIGMERFHVTPSPYSLHQLHGPGFDNDNHTFIFLDWDGTIEMDGQKLRENTVHFMDYYNNKNERLGWHKYVMIITSASFDLARKVMRHEDVSREIDAIYSVPGIGYLGDIRPRPVDRFMSLLGVKKVPEGAKVLGKLYSHICRKLNVNYRNAIILTDVWADKSVDKSYPITTLVTPEDLSADAWIKVISHFENNGSDIYASSSEIKRMPVDTLGTHTRRGERHWKSYRVDENLYLLRNPDMPGSKDCYFIEPGAAPRRVPSDLTKQFF